MANTFWRAAWHGNPQRLPDLTAEWPFPIGAALGSVKRAKGIEREIRTRLGTPGTKAFNVADRRIRLHIPADQPDRFAELSALVAEALSEIDALPVLPGEVDDILDITPRERLRWTRAGRLISAGARSNRFCGNGRAITFDVFDPQHVEDVLDRGLAAVWREEDRAAVAEIRRWAAGHGVSTRRAPKFPCPGALHHADPDLRGWGAFANAGLLR